MSLLTQQRALVGVLQGGAAHPSDPYLCRVVTSPNLDLVRDIGRWWKAFGIEEWCPLTSALLTQQGRFHEIVSAFCRRPDLSQYMEQTGAVFLTELSADGDPLTRSVARFELAMIQAAKGELAGTVWVSWDHHPLQVLVRLIKGEPAAASDQGRFRTRVSVDLPRLFDVQ
jgi:hypothetical protein